MYGMLLLDYKFILANYNIKAISSVEVKFRAIRRQAYEFSPELLVIV
jgi:hypothetical protein